MFILITNTFKSLNLLPSKTEKTIDTVKITRLKDLKNMLQKPVPLLYFRKTTKGGAVGLFSTYLVCKFFDVYVNWNVAHHTILALVIYRQLYIRTSTILKQNSEFFADYITPDFNETIRSLNFLNLSKLALKALVFINGSRTEKKKSEKLWKELLSAHFADILSEF